MERHHCGEEGSDSKRKPNSLQVARSTSSFRIPMKSDVVCVYSRSKKDQAVVCVCVLCVCMCVCVFVSSIHPTGQVCTLTSR